MHQPAASADRCQQLGQLQCDQQAAATEHMQPTQHSPSGTEDEHLSPMCIHSSQLCCNGICTLSVWEGQSMLAALLQHEHNFQLFGL